MKTASKSNPNITCLGYDILNPSRNESFSTGSPKTTPPPSRAMAAEARKSILEPAKP